MKPPVKNVVNFYHGGDLGDTVYAIPALRRLSHSTHLTLYPNPGVTRTLMDETNANNLLPLLNAQHNLTADWKPSYESTGLRLDMGVRRFYRDGFNLADIHSNWVGHDHWHVDHPWLVVDKPVLDSPYKVVFARSARYRNDGFPWRDIVRQTRNMACFVGVPWEHEDFEANYGTIPYVRAFNLLQIARVMAAADMFVGNQSCPRAIAEGLKMPVVVEIGRPNNTHFGREDSWYPAHCTGMPDFSEQGLTRYWIKSAIRRVMGNSSFKPTVLEELARLCRLVRTIDGEILEVGARGGGSSAMLSWCLQRPLHLCDDFSDQDEFRRMQEFLNVYHVNFIPEFPFDFNNKFVFAHVVDAHPKVLKLVQDWVLPRMSVGGIIVFNGASVRDIQQHAPKFGNPTPIDSPTTVAGLYTFRVEG